MALKKAAAGQYPPSCKEELFEDEEEEEAPAAADSVAAQRSRQAEWRPWQQIIESVDRLIEDDVHEGHRVAIDMGCGTGEMMSLLARNGWTPIGVDADDEMLGAARALCPSCRVEKLDVTTADAQTLRLDGPADLIWASFTVEYCVKKIIIFCKEKITRSFYSIFC